MSLRPESEYVKINVRITKRQLEWLRRRSEDFGQSSNWLIRLAISELIGRVGDKEKDENAGKQVP